MTTRDDQTLSWDVENRLIEVEDGVGTLATFIYDGDGKRIKKVTSTATTVYYNNSGQMTRQESPTLQRRTRFGTGSECNGHVM